MNTQISFAQKKFIEKQMKLGVKSQRIAEELGVSIWTVRKYRKRIKKGIIWKPEKVVHTREP